MIIIIIIIIIITLKGAIRDFLQSPTCTLKWPGHNRVQITCNTSGAYHVQHVVLHATWYEGTAQLLSLTELKSHLFELYFIGWTIKPMKEGRKREYPEKTPGNELQKMPHTKARRFKPQARLEPALYHWWQARKADMITITPRVAPTGWGCKFNLQLLSQCGST